MTANPTSICKTRNSLHAFVRVDVLLRLNKLDVNHTCTYEVMDYLQNCKHIRDMTDCSSQVHHYQIKSVCETMDVYGRRAVFSNPQLYSRRVSAHNRCPIITLSNTSFKWTPLSRNVFRIICTVRS